jgi:antirestriction protein ArdC
VSPGFFAPLKVPSVSGRDSSTTTGATATTCHRQSKPGAADVPERRCRPLAHGRNRAFYRPSTDSIRLRLVETCRGAESNYATLAHETTDWTADELRLARDFGTQRFGSEGYAIDELVAELGAAFLCADLDLTLEPREDHAAYIANWLQVLKADNRAIFTAASHAQRAAAFIDSLQPAGSAG